MIIAILTINTIIVINIFCRSEPHSSVTHLPSLFNNQVLSHILSASFPLFLAFSLSLSLSLSPAPSFPLSFYFAVSLCSSVCLCYQSDAYDLSAAACPPPIPSTFPCDVVMGERCRGSGFRVSRGLCACVWGGGGGTNTNSRTLKMYTRITTCVFWLFAGAYRILQAGEHKP